jgi:hypothetical protein
MSINYKIKLYYRVIGGPYHCRHHCRSHHCCQPPSFLSSRSPVQPHHDADIAIMPPPSLSWFRSCPRRIPAATAAVAAPTPKGCGRSMTGGHRCVVQELEGWQGAECSSHTVWSGLFASPQMAGRPDG